MRNEDWKRLKAEMKRAVCPWGLLVAAFGFGIRYLAANGFTLSRFATQATLLLFVEALAFGGLFGLAMAYWLYSRHKPERDAGTARRERD